MYPVSQLSFDNQSVAQLLEDISTAYTLKNKNRFRIISYQNAATTISTYPQDLYKLWIKNPTNIDNIPGVGEAILKKIDYFFRYKKIYPPTKKILDSFHPALFAFTKINSIGPKIAYKLVTNLKFPKDSTKAINRLITLCQKHQVQLLPEMKEKSELMILNNSREYLERQQKMTLSVAQKHASQIINYLHIKFPKLEISPLGSLRRQSPLIGDIDIVVKSNNAKNIIEYFINYPQKTRIINRGPKKASIKISHDIRIDLMIQSAKTFGSLLQHFTGSKDHNIKLRQYALNIGYSLSEYGIKEIKTGKIHTFTNEVDFYKFLKLHYIPPPERQGGDEIENHKML